VPVIVIVFVLVWRTEDVWVGEVVKEAVLEGVGVRVEERVFEGLVEAVCVCVCEGVPVRVGVIVIDLLGDSV